jgi:sigma-54 dependent transcriptional regulator, acetoin dehydrogenase operon transcriptional activator AcoR
VVSGEADAHLLDLPHHPTRKEGAMAGVTDEIRILRQARAMFLGGNQTASAARPEIVASWRRSQLSRVSVDHLSLPFTPAGIANSKLFMAAEPVLDEFAASLAGSPVSVLLADRSGRVVGLWAGERALERQLEAESIGVGFTLTEECAGTNGIGTALEMMCPVKVYGPEHYAEALHGLTCAAAPLRNPLSRHIEGVVNIACPNAEVNALLLPAVIDLARQIGREMRARSTHREQAVLEAFLLANQAIRGPIVAISDTFLMANSAAAPLLDGGQQEALWQQVPRELGETPVSGELQIDRGVMRATFRGVVVGGRTVGSIIELNAAPPIGRRGDNGCRDVAVSALRQAGLVGHSPAWQHVCANVLGVSGDRPVVILGETGVGKRALAEFLHHELRPGTLHVSSAGLEQVHGRRRWLQSLDQALADPSIGTVLISHAQDLTSECVRTVAELIDSARRPPLVVATVTTASTGLKSSAMTLLNQLNAQTITIPPLRERLADVRPIAEQLLRDTMFGPAPARLSADALTALTRYDWPGNVRELGTVLRETEKLRSGTVITSVNLPVPLRSVGTPASSLSRMEMIERDAIQQALAEASGNKSAAALALGISRKTLHRRIHRYRLESNGAF